MTGRLSVSFAVPFHTRTLWGYKGGSNSGITGVRALDQLISSSACPALPERCVTTIDGHPRPVRICLNPRFTVPHSRPRHSAFRGGKAQIWRTGELERCDTKLTENLSSIRDYIAWYSSGYVLHVASPSLDIFFPAQDLGPSTDSGVGHNPLRTAVLGDILP